MQGNDITTMIFSNAMFANDFYSFFKRTPALESLVAMSDCETFCLSFDELQHNFHTIPEFREFQHPESQSIVEMAKFPFVWIPAFAPAIIIFMHIAIFKKLKRKR